MNTESVLRFEDVSVSFAGEPALSGVSFEIHKGESRILLGAAGSGKTVVLKTALGLVKADSGRVFLFDQDITNMGEHELFEIRARAGILFQEGGLFDSLNIAENVAYPLLNQKLSHLPLDQVSARVEEILRRVELQHTLDKFPSELSGGMRRRVGIARANVTDPPLVLYDSPTAGLDPITANTIMALIVTERDLNNTTTVIVTHRYQDGQLLAKYHYDRASARLVPANGAGGDSDLGTKFMVMQQGRLIFEGTQSELEASTDPYITKFVMRH